MATVLKQCKINIWDECPMAHKHSLEALDRTLKGMRNNDKLFGGTLLLLSDVPIEFKRVQFPIRLAFAMTINKSQGQTMTVCSLDLGTPCLSHGQLYVAYSRVGKPSSFFVLAKDRLTKNIVHSIALRD
ncbi:uncharacterized protein LOC132942772 [Metopolophium dirhodum]|uniref:uncharacterized protein LOC132942772 n=1 Tax=Metopolophium dirhodum TaxID=44670 RepID=UPI00298FB1B5|nr:uncharacterized protein LOC132942772 [Metopolophium dirhodum]